jgi:hypothetical protein
VIEEIMAWFNREMAALDARLADSARRALGPLEQHTLKQQVAAAKRRSILLG